MDFKSDKRPLPIIPEIQLGIYSISACTDVVFLGVHMDLALHFTATLTIFSRTLCLVFVH